MATVYQSNVEEYYNNYINSIGSEIYRIGDRGDDFDDEVEWLKDEWNTDHGMEVCNEIEPLMAKLTQYMTDMEGAANRMRNDKISRSYESVSSEEKVVE